MQPLSSSTETWRTQRSNSAQARQAARLAQRREEHVLLGAVRGTRPPRRSANPRGNPSARTRRTCSCPSCRPAHRSTGLPDRSARPAPAPRPGSLRASAAPFAGARPPAQRGGGVLGGGKDGDGAAGHGARWYGIKRTVVLFFAHCTPRCKAIQHKALELADGRPPVNPRPLPSQPHQGHAVSSRLERGSCPWTCCNSTFQAGRRRGSVRARRR